MASVVHYQSLWPHRARLMDGSAVSQDLSDIVWLRHNQILARNDELESFRADVVFVPQ